MKQHSKKTNLVLTALLALSTACPLSAWWEATVKTDTTESMKQAKEVIDELAKLFPVKHILNEMRVVPVYAVGTTLLIASVNMYWQSLNDYLNITETDPIKLQAFRKRVLGKLKAGLAFSLVGIGTLYKSHYFAALCTGYNPALVSMAPIAA
ncbi:hypothetical protein JST99_03535 [Candidatus Dependentiae bacterium]|nr:hypothetical protein [Candidatus Dependentiae bacterium]